MDSTRIISDTEQIRAAVRAAQRRICGAGMQDFYSADFRAWVSLAADILAEAAMLEQKEQFHDYIQTRLAGQWGDRMSEFLTVLFEELGVELVDQIWP